MRVSSQKGAPGSQAGRRLRAVSVEFQAGGLVLVVEVEQERVVAPQGLLGGVERGHLGEVGILRHQCEALGAGMIPEHSVVRAIQAQKSRLVGAGEEVLQAGAELEAQVLVEQEPHSACRPLARHGRASAGALGRQAALGSPAVSFGASLADSSRVV